MRNQTRIFMTTDQMMSVRRIVKGGDTDKRRIIELVDEWEQAWPASEIIEHRVELEVAGIVQDGVEAFRPEDSVTAKLAPLVNAGDCR